MFITQAKITKDVTLEDRIANDLCNNETAGNEKESNTEIAILVMLN